MPMACDSKMTRGNISISIFKGPQRIVYYIPPLIELQHGHNEIFFMFISLKLLINTVLPVCLFMFITYYVVLRTITCIMKDDLGLPNNLSQSHMLCHVHIDGFKAASGYSGINHEPNYLQ